MSDKFPPLGHLVEFSVRGLFGDRRFKFRLDAKEPTLLTGANGSGKSTILRIIDAVGTGEWMTLFKMPFSQARLKFDSGQVFSATRSDDSLKFALGKLKAEIPHFDSEGEFLSHFMYPGGPEYKPGRVLSTTSTAYATFTPARMSGDRLLLSSPVDAMRWFLSSNDMDWLTNFSASFPLLFITDQRLIVAEERVEPQNRPRPTPRRTAVEVSAQDLGAQMQRALSDYASESQRLDRDFPYRVVQAMASKEEIPTDRLESLLLDVGEERTALQAVGLLPHDMGAEAFQQLPLNDPQVRLVIETFVRDTQKKFQVLRDLRERLTLFTEFLNQHYEAKRVQTLPSDGYRVIINGEKNRTILASDLSSGEQQILVLAYEILFRAEPGTLVLIDEPELSLHVLWQDTFVEDLTRMGAVRNLKFILATHSPTLIGGREHLKRSLDEAEHG